MQFDDLTYHRVQQVRHQGRLVTVAEASEPKADEHRLWFHILDLTPPTASETDEEGAAEKAPADPDLPPADTFLPLRYPDQVRLVGMEVVTTDAQDAGVKATTLGNWAIVSDGEMLYLFRSLGEPAKGDAPRSAPAPGYVYANRFAVVDVPVTGDGSGDGDGTSQPVLRAKVESRYRHSGMRDTPLDPDDSSGYRDMDGEVFSEPTMLFGMLAPANDRFTVALTPSAIAGVMRWQFLCATADGRLASYSYLRDTNGWPDLTGEARRLDTGSSNLRPDAVMTLEEESTGATLVLAGQPTSLLYRRQEQAAAPADDPGQDAPGDVGSAVTGPRLMLASLVVERGSTDDPGRLMVVELATDETGRPVVPANLRVPSVAETREAFDVRRLGDAGVDELGADLGLLEFPDIADVTFTDPTLLEAADGRIHLYTSGTTGTGSDAVSELLGFQYDTASSRARFVGRWVDTSGKDTHQGRLLVAARQVGPDGNDLSIRVQHDDAAPGFCAVDVAPKDGAIENWPGVPRELTRFLAVLNGEASDDVLDPLVANGTIPFYDYLGRRPTVRMPDPERTLVVTSALVAGQASPLPLAAVSLTPDGDSLTCTLDFEAATTNGVKRGWPVSLEFANVAGTFDDASSVLAGTEPGYHYAPGSRSDVSFSGQIQRIRSGSGAVDVVSVRGTTLQIRILDDPSSRRLCRVQIRWDDREVQFQSVPRDPDRLIHILNWIDPDYDYDADTTAGTKDAAAHFVVVGTNMEQRIANQTWQGPDASSWPNLSALYAVLVDPIGTVDVGGNDTFSDDDGLGPGAVKRFTVGPAQGPTGVAGDPRQGSSLVRAVALDRPTTGRPALVSQGAFERDQRGGYGGWLRERPFAATFPTGTVGSAPWDQQRSGALACRNDLTLEAWVRPQAPANDTDRPRILTVNGDTAEARYGLGLAAPLPNGLRIGNGNRMYQATGATPPSWTALWQFDPSTTPSPSPAPVFGLMSRSVFPLTLSLGIHLWYAEDAWQWSLLVAPGDQNPVYYPTGRNALSGWSQHAVRLDSDKQVLTYWVGEKLVHQSDARPAFQYLASPIALGYGGLPGLGFNVGSIASPRFYGEALSDARMAEIARYGAPLDDSGLLGAWEFERHDGLGVSNLSGARPEWLGNIEPDPNPDWGPVPGPEADGASRVFAAVGNRVAYGNEPVLPPDQWSHVAAVSTGSHALRFDGTQNAVVAEAEGLEPGDGFSIDTVLTWDGPKADGSPSVVFAKATARPSDPLNRLPSSYRLGIEPDGRASLDVYYEVKDGSKVTKTSRRFWGPMLTAGEAYSLAVACRVNTTGNASGTTSTISVVWHSYGPDATWYVDGVATEPLTGQVVLAESTDVAASIASPTAIEDSPAYGFFAGTIGLLRFWGRVLTDDEAKTLLPSVSVPKGMDEPAAEWVCNEGRSKLLRDSIAGADATLSSDQVWITSRLTAELDLYVNGKPAFTTTNSVARLLNGGFGPAGTIEVGGLGDTQAVVSSSRAEIAEVRVWDQARTGDQIAAGRWTRLRDRTEGLVGYWQLSAGTGTTFADSSGQGNDLTAVGYGSIEPPGTTPWVASTAPLANDGPQVRNPLGGAKTRWLVASASTPSAAEYGALRLDAAGEVTGTMERIYAYVDGTGALAIATGFGVGELDVQYVGQAQSPPTLVGYVEGPPPVPGENLTGPRSVTSAGYAGCTAVELTEAESTTYAYTTQMDAGPDFKAKLDIGNLLGLNAEAGIGYVQKIADAVGKVGFASTVDTVDGFVQSSQLSVGTTQRRTNRLSLVGAFQPDAEVDQALGRRYLPENLGYALVRSMAVNVFALRLRRTRTLVGLSTLPDPNIPEDWNLIMFPIEPTYTKLGTLDGRLGLGNDRDFPTADRERGSYFRPEEAYDLVGQIEANTADIAAGYADFNPWLDWDGKAAPAFSPAGDGESEDASLPQALDVGYDWRNDRPNRDLVDTYVWTASGGLFTEQQQTTSKRLDTTAGNFTVTALVGLLWDTKLEFASVGGFWDGNALVGAHVKGTKAKSRTDQRDFAISVKVDPEGDLRSYDAETNTWSSGPTPGKVDAYRFKTFYLAPKPAHFETFFDDVVDQNWYQNSQDAAAVALRQARSSRGGVWRVLHRTTYVSRIPPTFDTAPKEDASRPSLAVINTEANWWVLALVDASLRRTPGPTLSERIGLAVKAVLRTDLAAAIPWWQAFLDAAASNPTSRAAEEYATLSGAMYSYVLGYYRSNPGLVPDPGS